MLKGAVFSELHKARLSLTKQENGLVNWERKIHDERVQREQNVIAARARVELLERGIEA